MQKDKVTIVVVPRERFSVTQRSLENVYAETDYPFTLVYVDGNSKPSSILPMRPGPGWWDRST